MGQLPKNLPDPKDVVDDPDFYYVLQERRWQNSSQWVDEEVYHTYQKFYDVVTNPQYNYTGDYLRLVKRPVETNEVIWQGAKADE